MINNKDKEDRTQELAAHLEQLRTDLYKVIDSAIFNIARTCAGMTAAEVTDIVASVFHPITESVDAHETMAVAPAMATDAPSPDVVAEKPAPRRRGRKVVWAKSSDNALRLAYSKRRRAGRDIEPDLEAELIRRFPTYDAETKTFVRKHIKSRVSRPYKDLSNSDLTLKYHGARLNGAAIDDDLSAELARRFPSRYDTATRTLRDKIVGRQKKALRELSDATIKQMYYKSRSSGISKELNAELVRRFPAYNGKTGTFVDLRGGYRLATAEDLAELAAREAADAQRRRAEGQAKKAALKSAAEKKPETAPVRAPDAENGELVVTTKRIKISQDGIHYDVFVNGNRILHNHIDTQVETFLNGTVLGIHGRVTDIPNFPDNPSWQVYDTNMNRRTFSQLHQFTKKSVYIKNIGKIGDSQIALNISNNMRVIIDARPVTRIFKIADQKTK